MTPFAYFRYREMLYSYIVYRTKSLRLKVHFLKLPKYYSIEKIIFYAVLNFDIHRNIVSLINMKINIPDISVGYKQPDHSKVLILKCAENIF